MRLDTGQRAAVVDYRHRMRLAGRWGACFEVSCFIEHKWGFRRRDGVYQLADGTPVFKHAWNETDDGWIMDGTADQFLHGGDVDLIAPDDARRAHYREAYTVAHNPVATPWLAGRPWVGEPDDSFWSRRHRDRQLGPGWWLMQGGDREGADVYKDWLARGAETYPLFRAKRDEYRSLGYDI